MKNVLLISLACFTLFGCNNDKVTNAYLVGKWKCERDYYLRVTDTDYVSLNQKYNSNLEFTIEKDKLYLKKNNSFLWQEFNLSSLSRRETKKIDDNQIEVKTNSISKKSQDTFVMVENQYIYLDNYDSNEHLKYETICTRIK